MTNGRIGQALFCPYTNNISAIRICWELINTRTGLSLSGIGSTSFLLPPSLGWCVLIHSLQPVRQAEIPISGTVVLDTGTGVRVTGGTVVVGT